MYWNIQIQSIWRRSHQEFRCQLVRHWNILYFSVLGGERRRRRRERRTQNLLHVKDKTRDIRDTSFWWESASTCGMVVPSLFSTFPLCTKHSQVRPSSLGSTRPQGWGSDGKSALEVLRKTHPHSTRSSCLASATSQAGKLLPLASLEAWP